MLSLKDEMMKQEQYKDLLREAEKRALVRQALMGQEGHAPSVGRRLMAIVLQYFANLKCYLLEWYTSRSASADGTGAPRTFGRA